MVEPATELQVLGDQHDLRHDGGIDQGEALRREGQVALRQDQALIQHEQAENDVEVNEHQKKASHLVEAALLEAMQSITVHGRPLRPA